MAGRASTPGATDDDERILREAQLAYLPRRKAFVEVPSASSLVPMWPDLLVEAADKVEQDRLDSERFAAAGAVPTDDDREWEDAATRVAGDRWTSD